MESDAVSIQAIPSELVLGSLLREAATFMDRTSPRLPALVEDALGDLMLYPRGAVQIHGLKASFDAARRGHPEFFRTAFGASLWLTHRWIAKGCCDPEMALRALRASDAAWVEAGHPSRLTAALSTLQKKGRLVLALKRTCKSWV